MKVLDVGSMREVDRTAIEEIGIPSLVLMENAAIGVADALAEVYPDATSVGIVCGPGNNGGDGLALARHLDVRGYKTEVRLVQSGHGLSGDAQVQRDICGQQGIRTSEFEAGGTAAAEVVVGLEGNDLIVDALFGTGLKRPLEGFFAELVEAINSLPVPRVAIDVPSGLSGDSADIPGAHVAADLTVTLAAPKIPHVLYPASEAVGTVVVADLGIPPILLEQAAGELYLSTRQELAESLIHRPLASHKGDYGHCLIIAGSSGKAGAAILTARGAVRVGAGLVTVGAPEPIVQTVDLGSIESMTMPLNLAESGGLAKDNLAPLLAFLEDKAVLALGPGLGLDNETAELVRSLVAASPVPVVIDADGLNAFAGSPGELARADAELVLTPHPGELGRLLGLATSVVQEDRVGSARKAAAVTGAVVVLKGHQSLVARPDGRVTVNPTGNPGLATGGTGDVLTGVVAGLIGQGYETEAAARLGVFLHGDAGDLACQRLGQASLAAADIVEYLPRALQRLQP